MNEIEIREIKWHPKIDRIDQVASEGLEYALVSDSYEQVNQLVWCKDFLQDTIYSFIRNTPISIYKYKYDPWSCPPVSLETTRLIITNWKDKELGSKVLDNCLPMIHEAEEILGMDRRTTVFLCNKTPSRYKKSGVWLFEADKRWMVAPPMISFYSLMIRVGLVRIPGDTLIQTFQKMGDGKITPYFAEDISENDDTQDYMCCNPKNRVFRYWDEYHANCAMDGIKEILDRGDRSVFGSDISKNYTADVESLHEYYGIVGFSQHDTDFEFPQWRRESERKNLWK